MLICCVDYVEDYLVVEEGGSVKENFVYNSMFSTFYCISMTIVASNMTFDLVFVHNQCKNGIYMAEFILENILNVFNVINL